MDAAFPARGFLVDLDGTLICGGAPLPWARNLVERLHGRFVVLSNDAEHTPHQLSRRLRALRLPVAADRIVLAGTAALDLVAAERPGARVLLLGSRSLQRYASRQGLRIVAESPDTVIDTVILARDRHFTYRKLTAAVNAIRGGAELIVTNPDRTHPGADGRVVPETGALLGAVLACTGPVKYRIVGKPEATLFQKGLAMLGTSVEETVMIGDNSETDGIGAARAGMRYLDVGRDLAADRRATIQPALPAMVGV